MLNNKMILVTNDDGVFAEGIKLLVEHIYNYTHNIVVVAPSEEMSAISHALTIHRGLKLEERPNIYKDVKTYGLDGKPADCVRFAIEYLKIKPDYIISGCNFGLNMGDDILYSGTAAAAFEASLLGIKALAFSCECGEYDTLQYFDDIIQYINSHDIKNKNLLNINIPRNPKGIKETIQGKNLFNTEYVLENGLFYARGSRMDPALETRENTDIYAYHHGYISITPLTTDRTEK